VSFLINLSYGQSVNSFLTYNNSDMKFTIQHPPNWRVLEDEKSPHQKVWFKLSNRTMPIFIVQIHKVEPYLDTGMITPRNTSLQQYLQQRLDLISSLDIDYNLVRQNDVTVGGNVGLKLEFTVGNFFTSDIFTIAEGKLFELSYHDELKGITQNDKLADKMVESFQATK